MIALGVVALGGCEGRLDPTLFRPPEGVTFVEAGTPKPDSGACDVPAIFETAGCATCHDKTGSNGGFDMASAGWETHLVGVPPKGGGSALPSQCAGGGRVYLMAGSTPATGLFMDKLRPKTASSCGERMPILLDPLTTAQLDCVQQWANALTQP